MSSPVYPMDSVRNGRGASTYIFMALAALIAAIALAGIIATPILLWHQEGRVVSGFELPLLAGLLIIGVVGTVLMLLTLSARRRMDRLMEQVGLLEQRTTILAEQSVARGREAQSGAETSANPAELNNLLSEVRDILLLPQEQRVRRYQAMMEAEFQRRMAAAERFIASRDFHRARQEYAALVDRFGLEERIHEARARLERAAEQVQAQDIAQAATRLQDLGSLGRWDEAEQLIRELADKYPTSPEPAAMREGIARERKLFEQRNRQRMFEEVQQFVRQRRWREAAEGARRFLEAFPNDVEAPPMRDQLATLDGNAEIQSRQQSEQQYKDLIQQHRYWDALALARRIIGEFPMSPQAQVLRAQVARVEELARSHEPQR